MATLQQHVLLINPSMEDVYKGTFLKNSVPHYPPINLLIVAGALRDNGIPVSLLDLDHISAEKRYDILKEEIKRLQPTLIGVTFTSTLYGQCVKIAEIAKEINKDSVLVAGGSHASSKPEELVQKTLYDMAIVGEGEFALAEVMQTQREKWPLIKGLVYKNEAGKLIKTEKRPFIQNLDELPFPLYKLINIQDYHVPPSFCRKSPVATMETSRGCVWGCTYCNKSVFGRNFRFKTPERTVLEIEQLVALGYKEIHINDDMFTTSKDRVKKICRMLIEKNIKITWACPNGIRADRVDKELLSLMKQAGCYRVSFGAESGNQKVLNGIEKMQTVEEVKNAFKLCKEVGLIAYGFFMFGLPDDTEKTMQETIDFAKECDPDVAKFGIMIPLPSTPIYEKWKGTYITSENWDDYSFHKGATVYNHPTLTHDIINKYYKKSYREFYLRPTYIIRRAIRSLRTGQIFDDIRLLWGTSWFS